MQTPLQVTFNHMEPDESIAGYVEEQANKLEEFFNGIISCHVTIEAPHRNQQKGNLYRVLVDVTIPGRELVTSRNPDKHSAHMDLRVAIRDAFRAQRRQLRQFKGRRKPQLSKSRVGPPHGRIVRLLPEQDCGFIGAMDGQEIYFHRNAVLDGYERLEVGAEVRYALSDGEEGPQASTVSLVGRSGGQVPDVPSA